MRSSHYLGPSSWIRICFIFTTTFLLSVFLSTPGPLRADPLSPNSPDGGAAPEPASPSAYPLLAGMSCGWGESDCSPCAYDVEESFNTLRTHGDVLGFNLGSHPDPSGLFTNHWQGIQRIATGDGRYMVVTRDSIDDPIGDDWSGFAVVRMGSEPVGGDRLHLNRLNPVFYNVHWPPDPADLIVHTTLISRSEQHPGGVQTAGNYLAIGTGHTVRFYDLTDPVNPQLLATRIDRPDRTSSSTSMVMLNDGRYLLIVADSDAAVLDFYISNAGFPNVAEGFTHFDEWWPSETEGSFPRWMAFQSINLVTECITGRLYLIGTGYSGIFGSRWLGHDFVFLYRLDKQPLSDHARITLKHIQHKYCSYMGQAQCNFDAAAGIYVDVQGNLNLLSTEHWNNGPNGSIRMEQFRSQYFVSCPTTDKAWVELFEHDHFRGRSLLIDYMERDKEYYTNFDWAEDFEDKASSVRWCLPPNLTLNLYVDKDPCRGAYRLTGDGDIREIANLHDVGYGDRFSCADYVYDAPVSVWIDVYTGQVFRYDYPISSATALSVKTDQPSITVSVPPLNVAEPFTLTLTPLSPPQNVQDGLVDSGYAFWLQTSTDPYGTTSFSSPLEVTVRYDDAELGDILEDTLTLYGRSHDATGWIPLDQLCPGATITHDLVGDWIRGDVCESGQFALLGELPTPPIKWVLFDEAHGERNTLSWVRAQQLSDALDWHPDPEWLYFGDLEPELADIVDFVRHESGELTPEALDLYDVLMISAPDEPFSQDEVFAIHSYVRAGGGLVVLNDGGTGASTNLLLSRYGIDVDPGGLFVRKDDPTELDGDISIITMADHPAADDTATYFTNWGTSISVSDPAEWLASTWLEDVWHDDNDDGVYESGEEGDFAAGATYDAGCGRVVALGDNAFNLAYYDYDNNEFMRSILEWVSEGKACAPLAVYLPLVLR